VESIYALVALQQSFSNDENIAELYVEFSRFLEDHHGVVNSSFDSFTLIRKAAELGNAEAQHKLAAMYGSGLYINSLLPMDAGRSLLLYYTAALSGSPEANVAIGYRFANGIGVPESCELARRHYEYAANIVVRQIGSRGYGMFIEKRKLSDDQQRSLNKKGREVDEEIVDYHKHLAAEGDAGAAMSLAMMYISGSRVLEQDYDQAIKYLNYSSRDNSPSASGLLGYILVQGLGSSYARNTMEPSVVVEMLKVAAKHRDANGIVGLGLAYERGYGIAKNVTRAAELYQSALSKHQDAGFHLGELYMSGKVGARVDISAAMQAYASASQKGNTLALHRLGHMSSTGIGLPKHCPTAINSFKTVAERGDWMAALTEAHRRYREGDYAVALMMFSRYAALGEETSQFNVAEILSKHICPEHMSARDYASTAMTFLQLNSSKLPIPLVDADRIVSLGIETDELQRKDDEANGIVALQPASSSKTSIGCQIRALQFYGLSASQNDAEAMLRIGDMHYYGFAALPVDKMEAARFYQLAADLRNPHANFNLGVMYEAGKHSHL
jgi:SEL1 protein